MEGRVGEGPGQASPSLLPCPSLPFLVLLLSLLWFLSLPPMVLVCCPDVGLMEIEWSGRKTVAGVSRPGFRFSSAAANKFLWDPGQGLPPSGPQFPHG